jgi:glycosyltransferase involved in cell wall biosynthesis/ubiquinone/menaquinone biosynthesis C-methylase UbiE
MIPTPNSNILFISFDQNLLSSSIGDARRRHLEYANNFEQLFIIVLSQSKNHKKTYNHHNLHIYSSDSRSRWHYFLDAIKIASEIHKSFPISLVSTQDPFVSAAIGVYLKWRFHSHLNIQVHNDFYGNPYWRSESVTNRIFYYFSLWSIKQADSLRVVSRRIKSVLRQQLSKKIPIATIPVSPNTIFFSKPHQKTKDKKIIAVGRLDSQKDFSTLIQAYAKVHKLHPDYLLQIIGTGSQQQFLKSLVNKLNLDTKVKFLGNVKPKELRQQLISSRIYVSTSKYEGTSIAMLEAILTGLPAVITKVSGTEIITSGREGYKTAIGNAKKTASYLNKLINNPKLRQKMGLLARDKALSFLNTHRQQEWPEFLESLVKNSSSTVMRMKQINIDHYNSDITEIDKASDHPSKIVYYPKFLAWLKKQVQPGQTIVDIGGGAGVLISQLNEQVKNLDIIGLDISHLMIKLRQKLNLPLGVVGDMDQLPIKANSADCVIFVAAIHHTLNTDLALKESFRVLKPGGKLLLIELNSLSYLLQPIQDRPVPSPFDPRECLINHKLITRQARMVGFKIKQDTVHRQLATIIEKFIHKPPYWLYRLVSYADNVFYWIPIYREIGNLSLINAFKSNKN